MKALLVTGSLAYETVKAYAKNSAVETEVFAVKGTVAALLSPQKIAEELAPQRQWLKGFDVVLVPGLMRGDAQIIADAIGKPVFKGSRYAADLPTVLESMQDVKLSTTIPACDLLKEKLQQKAFQELENVEKNREHFLKNPHNLLVGDLAVGKDFPMRVLGEIVDAPLMPLEEVQRLAVHFVESGADLIDVGMVVGECRPEDAKKAVEAIKQVVKVPVSIDTLNPIEIEAAVGAGAEFVLSGDAGNLEAIAPFTQNVAVVLIPTNQREGYFPKTATERVVFLEEIVAKAKKLGLKKILADLILEPTNVLESMIAFRDFANRNPDIPLFVGISNVTELIDVDSVGVNALLARLSAEVDGSVLLATEKSTKAKGTVHEEAVAAKMMFLAKKRGSVPKDLGIDLLILKDKRNHEEPYNQTLEAQSTVVAVPEDVEPAVLDSLGAFKIFIDHAEGTLVAAHCASADLSTPLHIVKGKTAEGVCAKIVALGLVSRLDHAAYLGGELAKAEVALKTGKDYLQDMPLFKK
jgi:dihydropteroate synthase-like protein